MSNIAAIIEEEEFRLVTTPDRDRTVVTVRGSVDVSNSGRLAEALAEALDPGTAHIVLDVSEATFIDSTALGALVLAWKRARQIDVDFVIAGARGEVRRVFEITGLERTLSLVDSPHTR